jgi:chemotaxis signal transduction protein
MRLDAVVEVMHVERLVRLPLPPPSILGLAPLRRDLVPVVDLAPSVGDSPAPWTVSCVLVVATNKELWGIAIDQGRTQVEKGDPEQFGRIPESAPEALTPGGGLWHRRGETRFTVIDPDAAWGHLRGAIKAWCSQSAAASPATVSETT